MVNILPDRTTETRESRKSKNEKHPNKDGNDTDKPSGIKLPEVLCVEKENWGHYDMDEKTALVISQNDENTEQDGETQYDFYINIDNFYLDTQIKDSRIDADILKEQFVSGLSLIGIGLVYQDIEKKKRAANSAEKNENEVTFFDSSIEDRVRYATASVAPFLLPIINDLGDVLRGVSNDSTME